MDGFSAAGALAALTGVVAYFTAREKSVLVKLEIEKKGQEMLFHRLHEMEGREMFRERRMDELSLASAEQRHRHDKLQWEHEELKKENTDLARKADAADKRAASLKAELEGLYNSLQSGNAVRPLKPGRST